MKKILSLIAIAAACQSAWSDVIIYAHTTKQTTAGAFKTSTTNYTGYLVLGTDYGAGQIDIRAAKKTFSVHTDFNYRVRYIRTTATKQRVCFADNRGLIGANFLKGYAKDLNVGTVDPFFAPPSLSISGSFLSEDDAPNTRLVETSGLASFHSVKTKAANALALDVDGAMDMIRDSLLAKGYTETP